MDAVDVFALARRGSAAEVLERLSAQPELLSAREPGNQATLLHIFARLSDAAAVSRLLELGAEAEARDVNFCTALHLAARADATPERTSDDSTAAAAPGGGQRAAAIESTLRALLSVGRARVTARDQFGLTALHHAAQAGNTETVGFLLGLNTSLSMPRAPLEADTNAEDRPLHLAAAGGHAATVRSLLEHGAHPEKTNYVGETALHVAAAAGDAPRAIATLRELCRADWRVDLNAARRDGATPLHVAAARGHEGAVRALLRAPNVGRRGGARAVRLDATDRAGRTPRMIADAEGFDDVVEILDGAVAAAAAMRARAPKEEEEALRAAMREMRVESARRGGGLPAHAEDAEMNGGDD